MLIAFFVLVLLFVLFLLINIRVEYKASFSLDLQVQTIIVSVTKLFSKKYVFMGISKLKEERRQKLKKYYEKLKLKGILKLFRKLISLIHIKRLSLKVIIGTKNAYRTALCCGAAMSVFHSAFIQILPRNKLSLQKGLKVLPDFKQESLELKIHCILSFKIVHIIIIALYALKIAQKERVKNAPNRKYHENDYGTAK